MTNPKELAIKANDLRKEFKYKEALECYKKSWDDLKDAYTGAGLLHCLRKLEDFEYAVPFSEKIINLFSSIDWVRNEVAWTLVSGPFKQVNKFPEALLIAEKIGKITSNPIILKKIAFKLVKLADNYETWQVVLQWLKKVNPEDLSEDYIKNTKWSDKSQWKYNFYKTLLKIGQYKEIISNIDECISKYSQINEFFLNLKAKSFEKLERFDDSAKIYEELLKYKRDWWIYKDYADLLLKMNLKEDALKMYHQAVILNKSKKMMINVYYKIGNLCLELGKDEEALYHFILSKLIREKEDWSIPEEMIVSIKKLSESLPDISKINAIKQIFSECREFWIEDEIKDSKIHEIEKSKRKTFEGVLSIGRQNRPFCFINTKEESIICDISILPSNIKDNDEVKCEAITSYDKKKQKKSWKAIKVDKI